MARYIFRALNHEDIDRINGSETKPSILAKAPHDTQYTLFNFVMSGSRLKTRFIAMTDSVSVADLKYASLDPLDMTKRDAPVVLIDLDKLQPDILHDCPAYECVEYNHSLANTAIFATEADNEIIYENEIPAEAYHEIPPLLLDVLTGYDLSFVRDEHKDRLCDRIVKGESEEIIKKLLENVSLNDIEKAFIEKYYGLIFNQDGSVRINNDKNQPLKGDMVGIEKYLKEKFHIEARDSEMPPAFLGRCIQSRILNHLNYEAAQVVPLKNYSSPVRENLSAMNMQEGRYHKNYIGAPKQITTGVNGYSGRRVGKCLVYSDFNYLQLPIDIAYHTSPEGHIALHLFSTRLIYDPEKYKYREVSDFQGRSQLYESVYFSANVREQGVPTKEILKTALGKYSLTKAELVEKQAREARARREEQQRKIEQERRATEERVLRESQKKGKLTPEIMTQILRQRIQDPRTKFHNNKGKELKLVKDEAYERFMQESIFDTPLQFSNKSNKKIVQMINVKRIPTVPREKKGLNGEIITYYKPESEKYNFVKDLPSEFFYIIEVMDNKGMNLMRPVSTLDNLNNWMKMFMDQPERQTQI